MLEELQRRNLFKLTAEPRMETLLLHNAGAAELDFVEFRVLYSES